MWLSVTCSEFAGSARGLGSGPTIPPKGSTNSADFGKNLMTIQEGALAAGETSGNLGMYLGLGVKDDIVEPENEICE